MTADDIIALSLLIETDMRYDAAVVNGRNGRVAELLNERDPNSSFVWEDATAQQLVIALAGVTGITTDQQTLISIAVSMRDNPPTSDPTFRNDLPADVVTNLRTQNSELRRRKTYAEVAGLVPRGRLVRRPHVGEAVEYVAKSFVIVTGQKPLKSRP